MRGLGSMVVVGIMAIFMFSCTSQVVQQKMTEGPKVTQKVLKKETPVKKEKKDKMDFYVKHNTWTSPFNPHKVLRTWIKLTAFPIDSHVIGLVVGNPKINWSDYTTNEDPTKLPIPSSESASAVVFFFLETKRHTIELICYGYRDSKGNQLMYGLNDDNTGYVLISKKSPKELDPHKSII